MRLLAVLLSALILAGLLAPATAPARVAVVASGTADGLLLDVVSNKVGARIPLPGPAVGAAVAPDGRRGFWAAGSEVVAADLDTRKVSARSKLSGPVLGIAAAGDRIVAVTASDLVVLGETVPSIDKYLLPIIGVIVFLSVLPPLLEWRKHRKQVAPVSAAQAEHEAEELEEILDED